MQTDTAPAPPVAVASIIASMGLIAAGNGIMHSFVPLRLSAEGFEPWVAGSMVTAVAAGSLAGCFVTGLMVRRVGRARVFATLTALVIVAILAITVGTLPVLWIFARATYGLAMTGLFIVSQSWLNDACSNEWRGRVTSFFYLTYVMSLGTGAFTLRFVDIQAVTAPLLAVLFSALAILPAGMTRLATPPPPVIVKISIPAVWRISPVGFVGLLAVGGLTLLVQGFAPIYTSAIGWQREDIALLIFLMQFGMIGLQLPLGAISDRTDRRYMLILASVIVICGAAFATQLDGASLVILIVTFAIWGGATESIYSIANAHANDRADPEHYVPLASTLLVAWSVSGLVLPGIATALTPYVGPRAFMFVAMAVAAAYGLFVLYRLTRREAVGEDDAEPYQPISAQAPYPAELPPVGMDQDQAH